MLFEDTKGIIRSHNPRTNKRIANFKDTKGVIRNHNPRTDKRIANLKGQTMIHKTLHMKLKIEQHEPH